MILAAAFQRQLAYGFAAGLVAAVNPCGFAMLPAYLSFFLGLEGEKEQRGARTIARALGVSAVMTTGFVAVFALVGTILAQLFRSVAGQVGWLTMAIGLVLVGLGIALLAGKELNVRLPKLGKGGTSRELWSVFLFGVSYAVASLSCTITPFLAATATTFNQRGLLAGMIVFVAYGVGMGALIAIVTVAVALARDQMVRKFRQLVRFVNRASGALMVLAGLYVAYYGWYEARGKTSDPVIDRAWDLQRRLDALVGDHSAIVLALAGSTVTAGIALWLAQRRHRARPTPTTEGSSAEGSTAEPGADSAASDRPELAGADRAE